jgi:hypothetical protein
MKNHVKEEQLIGYVQHTLTDAQREVIDQHLTSCAACRARLNDHQALQRRIRQDLSADLGRAAPSPRISFDAIAPLLASHRFPRRQMVAAPGSQLLPAAAALGGLVLSVMTLVVGVRWVDITWPSLQVDVSTHTPLPLIACFFFSIPVLANYREQQPLLQSKPLIYGVTVLLWLGTALIGLYEIFVMRELLYHVYVLLGGRNPGAAIALGAWGVMLLALVWIGAFIGGAEYHYQHVGERRSWRLFGWTIAVECVILLLAYLI